MNLPLNAIIGWLTILWEAYDNGTIPQIKEALLGAGIPPERLVEIDAAYTARIAKAQADAG